MGEATGDNRVGKRGQTHVVGFVLLVGLVAIASVAVVVLGASVLDGHERSVELEAAEGAMVEFAGRAATTGATDQGPAAVSFGPYDRGFLESRSDAGRITVTYVGDDEEVLYDEPIGTLAYVTDDTEIGYQGGGVWRTDGDGTTTVSSPDVSYREETLAFHLVHLDGDRLGATAVDGTVKRASSPTPVDLEDRSVGARDGGVLRLDLESEYCEAWERELEATIDGGVVERCAEDRPDRVRVELIVLPEGVKSFDSAIIAESVEIHDEAPPVQGNVRTASSVDADAVNGTVYDWGYDYPSADDRVEAAVDGCEGSFEELPSTVTAGHYCVDAITDDHEFDTSDGAIDVVVKESIGDPNYRNDLRVEGAHKLTIYTDGDVSVRGNARIGNESTPDRTRLVVSSNGSVSTVAGTPEIAALIYAPDATVTFQGNPTIVGTTVGDAVEVWNVRPGEVRYGDRMESVESIPGAGPTVRYATITAYDVEVVS